jgi:hypothetical protein
LGGVQVFVLPTQEASETGGVHGLDIEIAFTLLHEPAR